MLFIVNQLTLQLEIKFIAIKILSYCDTIFIAINLICIKSMSRLPLGWEYNHQRAMKSHKKKSPVKYHSPQPAGLDIKLDCTSQITSLIRHICSFVQAEQRWLTEQKGESHCTHFWSMSVDTSSVTDHHWWMIVLQVKLKCFYTNVANLFAVKTVLSLFFLIKNETWTFYLNNVRHWWL